MMRWTIVVVLGLALVACGSSKQADPAAKGGTEPGAKPADPGAKPADPGAKGGAGATRTFALSVLGEDAPVAVELAVPADWVEDATMSKPDAPSWKLEGALMLSLTAIAPAADDAAALMAKAIKMQYGDDPGVERTDLPDGRVWIVAKDDDRIHARMFVPFAKGVVMGVAMLGAQGDRQLPAIKQAFETIKIK